MYRFIFFIVVLIQGPALFATVILRSTQGQFGNQLFQIAASVALAKENDCPLSLPSYLSHQGNPAIQNHYKVIYKRIAETMDLYHDLGSPSRIYNDGPLYSPIPYQPGLELLGYFQNEKYFKRQGDLIRRLYAISEPVETYLQENFTSILAHPKTVGIHVRTYYQDWQEEGRSPNIWRTWLAPDIEFYKRAIELFDEDSLFVVCSDYLPWCKKNFQEIPRNFIFMENQEFIHDFFLLTKCKGLIISASTFGWWAAYLNENPDKRVVYRNPFFYWLVSNTLSQSLYNPDWTALDMPEVAPAIPVFE